MGSSGLHSLPRLQRIYYQQDAVVHWTMTTQHRATGWLTNDMHTRFRELMLHTAAREGLCCPVYCLMPDHMHLVWMGLRPDTDQLNGMAFLRTYLGPVLRPHRFQHQAHDHVFSDEERERNAFAKVCFYILNNPVRAGLVQRAEDWEFSGSVIPGYPVADPRTAGFWDRYWKWYVAARDPATGNRMLPPRAASGGKS